MTVFGYLDFVAALYKVDDRPGRVLAAMERVDLVGQAQTRIGKLCKNMQKRVGLAQAIVNNPDVLILDEPTYGLDPRYIVEMQSLIKSLGNEYTLLLATRTLAEAEQICDRVLMLNKGQIVAEDTPTHLTARLEGGQRIRLQTTSAPPDALDILQSLEGVSKVSVIETGTFDIECSCSIDCRPVVAKMVVQQGWGLLEIRVVDGSLEDVYLELTTDSVSACV
jgi:ABC-2 type transport system ATP-binding protein